MSNLQEDNIKFLKLINTAELLIVEGSYTQLLMILNDAIELNQDDPWSYYLRGTINFILKDHIGSKSDFEVCRSLGADVIKYSTKASNLILHWLQSSTIS